ncbi:MAG TPA: CD225/dispanin family protein [Dermatophilaceae bacterium]|jgi:Interferon-induced transmembrane protein
MSDHVSTPPPNHLAWALLSTLLCCPPFGIASIVFSSQVNSKWATGDVAGAHLASDRARKLAIWAAVAGVVFYVLVILGIFGLHATGASAATGY